MSSKTESKEEFRITVVILSGRKRSSRSYGVSRFTVLSRPDKVSNGISIHMSSIKPFKKLTHNVHVLFIQKVHEKKRHFDLFLNLEF